MATENVDCYHKMSTQKKKFLKPTQGGKVSFDFEDNEDKKNNVFSWTSFEGLQYSKKI